MPPRDLARSIGIIVLVGAGIGVTAAFIGHFLGVTGAPLGGIVGGITAVLVGRLVRKPRRP